MFGRNLLASFLSCVFVRYIAMSIILIDCRSQVCSNQSIDAGGYFELRIAIVVSTFA
jgi:hypothetical protein